MSERERELELDNAALRSQIERLKAELELTLTIAQSEAIRQRLAHYEAVVEAAREAISTGKWDSAGNLTIPSNTEDLLLAALAALEDGK